jgi:hypothetical protein
MMYIGDTQPYPYGTRSSHVEKIRNRQNELRNKLRKYKHDRCPGPPPGGATFWAYGFDTFPVAGHGVVSLGNPQTWAVVRRSSIWAGAGGVLWFILRNLRYVRYLPA